MTAEANILGGFKANHIVIPKGLRALLTQVRKENGVFQGWVDQKTHAARIQIWTQCGVKYFSADLTEKFSEHNFVASTHPSWTWRSEIPWTRKGDRGVYRGKEAINLWIETSTETPSLNETLLIEKALAMGAYVGLTVQLASALDPVVWYANLDVRGDKRVQQLLKALPSEKWDLYDGRVWNTSYRVEFEL